MANKKRRLSQAKATSPAQPQQRQQPPSSGPAFSSTATRNALRLMALMAATAVALLVYELLVNRLSFLPALIIGFVAAILARAFFIWLERLWIRSVIRKAQRRQAAREAQEAGQPKAKG